MGRGWIAGIAVIACDRKSKTFDHKGHPFDALTLAQGRLRNAKGDGIQWRMASQAASRFSGRRHGHPPFD
jgi:hypothetical protein